MNTRLITAVLTLVMLSMFAACNSGGGGGGGSYLTVQPLYPINGADWNDYVSSSTGTATDTACNAATDTACLHAGEVRVVEVTGKTSCTGLTASDALGAFDWTCDESTGTARFISTGLKAGKYLSDLIDFTAISWKANSVTVYDGGTPYYSSPQEVWWSNPIVVDNDGGLLAASGTIYAVTSSMTGTFTLDASKVTLVSEPGVTISGPGAGTASYVVKADGSTGSAKDFIWIESKVNAIYDDVGIYLKAVKFSSLRNVEAKNAGGTGTYRAGIYLASSTNNTLSDVTVTNCWCGVSLSSSGYNALSGVSTENNETSIVLDSSAYNTILGLSSANDFASVYLNLSSYNTLSGVSAKNNGVGIRFNSSSNNTLSDVSIINSDNVGFYFSSSSNNVLSKIVSANNNYGIALDASSYNTFSGLVGANNRQAGVDLRSSSDNNIFADISATNNGAYGVYLGSSSNNKFTGILKVGSNMPTYDCYVSGGTNPGLVSNTCANQGSSDATLTMGVDLSGSFVAKVTMDDTANQSDINGTATYPADPSTFDWTNFNNIYRSWGKDGIFGNADSRGRWTTGAGRIWDWSLKNSDAVIKGVLSLPTGGQTLTHTWSDATTTTFLRHAVEISGDGIGNDNLLCESNETCLYTPNIGAYQGHGSLINAGTIGAGGTIQNVVLKKYTTNGY